jgi:MFS family permease
MIRHPIAILVLLTWLNFLNYVDRYLVAAVSPEFRAELSLTRLETGLAISAFMVGYFVTSPIFGFLGDRARATGKGLSRTQLMAIGVALWSVATAASGLAHGAVSLIGARIFVGIGEASYATIAPTIIDDLAPKASKNRWLAVFYVAIPVGSALGYLLGGMMADAWGWRSAFFVGGGPGVVLALLVLLVREPPKPSTADHAPGEGYRDAVAVEQPRAALSALRGVPVYVWCVVGSCAYTFALGGFAGWAPTFLVDVHHMMLMKADFGFGFVAVLAGIVGTTLGGVLADIGLKKDVDDDTRVRRYLKFSAWTSAIAVVPSVLVLMAPSPVTFFAWIFVCETALFASTSPINAVILGSVPSSLRTTAMATSIFCIHAFGDFPSPPLIGEIADFTSLRAGLAILPVAICLSAVAWFVGARPRARAPA